jgi:hypothetical protein
MKWLIGMALGDGPRFGVQAINNHAASPLAKLARAIINRLLCLEFKY